MKNILRHNGAGATAGLSQWTRHPARSSTTRLSSVEETEAARSGGGSRLGERKTNRYSIWSSITIRWPRPV